MAYTKQTWANGDVVTSSKLNHMEDGIEQGAIAKDAIAPDFDSTESYSIGDYCIHEGTLYRFKNAHTGAWNASDVYAVNVGDEVEHVTKDMNNLQTIVWTAGYIDSAGRAQSAGDRWYSNYLVCPPNTQVSYVAETNHNNIFGISFYDSNKNIISGFKNNGTIGTEVTVTSPDLCAFCRLSTKLGYRDVSYYKIANQGVEFIVGSLSPLIRSGYITFITTGTNRSQTNHDINGVYTVSVVNNDYEVTCGYTKNGNSLSTPWSTYIDVASIDGTPTYLQMRRADNGTMPTGIVSDVVTCTRVDDIITQKNVMTGYVRIVGSDSNSGLSRTNALRTIQSAINKGFKNIIVSEGTYSESLSLIGLNGVHISLDMSRNNYSTENPDNPKVVIDGTDGIETGVVMNDCHNCTFENIEVCNCSKYAWQIDNCTGIKFFDCIAHDIAVGGTIGGGFTITDSNIDLYNCNAYNIGTTTTGTAQYHLDGFNIHNTGVVNLFDCNAWNCEDDGVSHHDACSGTVDGGEWHHCGKGGISSPTHGAVVNIKNAYSHDNHMYGLYASSDHALDKSFLVSNCVFKNNGTKDITIGYYTANVWNCIFSTQETSSGGTINVIS